MIHENPKKRVLFVDHTASMGGGEIALFNVVMNLDRSRFDPVVLLFSDGPLLKRLSAVGCEITVMPLAAQIVTARKDRLGLATLLRLPAVFKSLAFVWRLRRYMEENRIDLVHTNSLKGDVLAGLAARLANIPLIWHIRDRIDADYLPWVVVYVFRWLCRCLPDFIIANSAATLGTVGLDRPERGVAIPSGIDIRSRVVHDGMRPTQIGDLPDRHPGAAARIVGLVGRISPWKGQDIFLKAAAQVHQRFPEVRFQIVGAALFSEQIYEGEVRRLATDLGLDGCVDFTGFREDVPALISQMEILVHASVTAEPFGQVVIEGMAAAKPVVATAGGGVLEIVLDGVTGLLVPMNDVNGMSQAIGRLLENPELARQMGQRGYARVMEQFTIRQTVDKIERVYDEVLTARRMIRRAIPGYRGYRGWPLVTAISLGLVLIAFSIHAKLRHWFGEHTPVTGLFLCVVVMVAQAFGVAAGLVASACSLVAMVWILPPNNSWAVDQVHRPTLVFFLIFSLFITHFIGRLKRAQQQARAAQLVAEEARKEAEFIASAALDFAACTDQQSLLQAVGRLLTPRLGDWCIIDLLAKDQTLYRAFTTHHDLAKCDAACQLRDFPPPVDSDNPSAKVIRSRVACCLDQFRESPQLGQAGLQHAQLLTALGDGPALIIPMNTADNILGAISLIRSNHDHPYNAYELKLACEFAWHAAIAFARLERLPEIHERLTAAPQTTVSAMSSAM